MKERMCLMEAADGEWYCIPYRLRDEFEELSAWSEDGGPAKGEFDRLFGDCLLHMDPAGNYTFTDWEEAD